MEYDRSQLNWIEREEPVWVVRQGGEIVGVAVAEAGCSQLPTVDREQTIICDRTTLFRPALAPVYGGPTLLEALWQRMDDHMEALMTGQEGEDTAAGARELAWVIAITTNAYEPSMDKVRAEAMDRWRAVHDEDDKNTRPAGADQ
jgi:hypothetical protein